MNGTFASLNGTATNLGEGAVFTFNSQFYEITYQASFAGNSFTGGNDVALLAVPEPAPPPRSSAASPSSSACAAR